MKQYVSFFCTFLLAVLICLTWNNTVCAQESQEGVSHQRNNMQEAVPEPSGAGESVAPQEKLYTCPMPSHNYFSHNPGECPTCGMELEEVTKEKEGTLYRCPMPEDDYFSHQEGTCPKCGMKLVPNK